MISIIIPCYNEADNLLKLHERISATTSELPLHRFEIIYIDDCSNDQTPQILEDIANNNDNVEIIRFARNCGSHSAVAAGLKYCKGDAAIMLAADLQDPPEVIPLLINKWEQGFRVVWGVRKRRQSEKITTIALSRLFYFLMNRLADVKQEAMGADIFLIDRTVVEAFKNSPEKNTSVFMLIAWLGFSQTNISYVKETRYSGFSKWTFSKRLKLFFDSLISFSYIPLRFMSLIGSISAFLGFIYLLVVFVNALAGNPVQGWSSLMIVVLILGGFQMCMMGMLGEYLWRTYDETRGRPRYVIEKMTLLNESANAGIEKAGHV